MGAWTNQRKSIPGRAWILLGAASVSALGLAAVALLGLGPGADPALAGEATLARLAGEVADGVVEEWERLRRTPEPFPGRGALTWRLEPAPESPVPALAPVDDVVLDALLAETVRLEHAAGDAPRALEIARTLLDRPADPRRRARILLRVAQLARRTGDDALARTTWNTAQAELAPSLALDGTSALLLVTLAAGPALEIVERAAARDRLAALWIAGTLALPPADEGAEELELAMQAPAPRRAELRRRLQELVPEAAPDARLARTELADRARVLATAFDPLPRPAGEAWELLSGPTHELLLQAAGPDEARGLLLPAGTTRARLAEALAAHELLPPDFALDFEGTHDELGPLVRERTELAGTPLAFAVRHAHPERVRDAVASRAAWVRGALLVLALFTAAAGLSTFRALVRERRLAATKSAFVANVSHELRTPIASILLLAENLERGKVADEGERRRYHGLIRREAERLRGLVEDVLDMARLERGEAPNWRRTPLATRALVDTLESAARERVAASGGAIDVTTRALPEQLFVDVEAVRRALLNLVENALLHSGSSELELDVHGDGAGGLVLALRDHGRGVPSEAYERIFEPFARLEHADAAPGTGLGLAIVREVARAHGGSARVRAPAHGPGAVFELHLGPGEGSP